MEDHVVFLTLGKEKQTHTSFKLIFKQQAAQSVHLTHFHYAPVRIGSNTLTTWRNVFVIGRGIMESSRMRNKFCGKYVLRLVAHVLRGPRRITAWDWAELAAKAPLASHGVSVCLSFSICLGSYHSDNLRGPWEAQCHSGMWVLRQPSLCSDAPTPRLLGRAAWAQESEASVDGTARLYFRNKPTTHPIKTINSRNYKNQYDSA